MKVSLKVPTIACDVCAQNIKAEIKGNLPTAQVQVDVAEKIVTVEAEDITDSSLRSMIIAVGHKPA